MARTINGNLRGMAARYWRAEALREVQRSAPPGYCQVCGAELANPRNETCYPCWREASKQGVSLEYAAALLAAWREDGCPENDPRSPEQAALDEWQADCAATTESVRP